MINHPYYEQCPKCGNNEIVTYETGLKQCQKCWAETEQDAIWAHGPGIKKGMTTHRRQQVMDFYWSECRCLHCGKTEGLKVIGYTERGRGIPARLCEVHRHPMHVALVRRAYEIRPQDQTHVTKQLEEAMADEAARRREIEREKGAKAYENRRRRPVVGQTGKTAKKKKNG